MKINILKKIGLIALIGMGCLTNIYASPLTGYWKSVDDRTGEALSIIEIKKLEDGTYGGFIVHRFAAPGGVVLTNCTKCPEPYKNKPLLGMQILSGFIEDPKKENHFIHGKVLEAKSGKIFEGKGQLTTDGRRFRLRGFVGVSMLGRTQVWVKVNDPQAEINK
ncbi:MULTISPECIES: DUF2147 domain-containing protein [unclassified Acinetobacter]|uniref:DUF2147 domain-containing protein n=1 Tax=unclassified Acinetobacter TaxID=196816 RepID=UPI002577875C|nr:MULTISPECIES: DUF2147 domain-containing protein [unclassified Acinetobacter]MDM1763689.1 DUF2147 domain-containing protein [Acinetobacter sp. 226-1]MDM1767168.1 DUF2147 domain-containing protein [Acinetobacter sp. 226-4]